MSRKKRYIVLTTEENQTLEQGAKYGPTIPFRERCKCLVLSNKQYSIHDLRDIFSTTAHTIGNWLTRWEEQGLGGLYTQKGRGRKLKLKIENESHQQALDDAVKEHAQDVEGIREVLEAKTGLSLSKDTVKRFLKKTIFDGNVCAYRQKNGNTQKNIKTK